MRKILLLFFIPIVSFAQDGAILKEIDSLKKVTKSKIAAEDKIEAYGQWLSLSLEVDSSESQKIIDELYALSKSNSCITCETMADFSQGNYNSYLTKNKLAIKNFEDAASKSLKIKDYDFYQYSKTYKIQTLLNINELEKADQELKSYFKIAKQLNINTGNQTMYYLLGQVNFDRGFYTTAIENYLLADKLIKDNKKDNLLLKALLLDQISLVYKTIKNYDKANEYIEKSIAQSKKNNDPFQLYISYMGKGAIEIDLKNFKQAIPYFKKAIAYFQPLNDIGYVNRCTMFLGICNYELNLYQQSLDYLIPAAKIYQEADDSINYASCLVYISKSNLRLNNLDLAKSYLDKTKLLIDAKVNTLFAKYIMDLEIEYYVKTNNLQKTLNTIISRDSLVDILNNNLNLTNINELEAKYQTEKKEQQIKLLSTQNELAQKQKYIYIGLLGLLALIGGSLFYGYRNKIKTAQKLNELNELKSRFFANISHEFRTPLTLIKSPVQSLQNEISDVNQKNKLNLIDANSSRMLQLVDQLLELSKIDSGNLKLILKDGNISSFLTSIIEPFQFQSKEKAIHFTTNIQKTIENNSFDKDVIEKIVTNLVSNAFKYSPQNEQITFSSSVENSNLKLVVSNTGSDIKKEDLPKLFERFYQKNETQQGVGIGLALVKELVDLYKGSITTSVDNGELSFAVNLPLSIANENAVVIPTKENTSTIENPTSETELPILLIVDDNAEIRSVVKDIFKNDYQILEAQDGEEGLQWAQNQIPDCIISDVMMPKMDGFEFTKAIKSNELTSFIPVILLTAKTSDEAHLEGLKSTADAFLTKPFNNEIVKATVQQLITERKKLHARYSQELVLKPVDIVINSAEEKFIERLQTILDKNLSNSEYTAEDFASEIGMSRMQLHRKLKSLLGVSATEFLRNERLKVGAELLKQGNGNISEIAYSVGFSDVSYFSKCFKEMYQCTPSEFTERN